MRVYWEFTAVLGPCASVAAHISGRRRFRTARDAARAFARAAATPIGFHALARGYGHYRMVREDGVVLVRVLPTTRPPETWPVWDGGPTKTA